MTKPPRREPSPGPPPDSHPPKPTPDPAGKTDGVKLDQPLPLSPRHWRELEERRA